MSYFVFGQEQEEWEPETHITGYINTVIEYASLDSLDQQTGIGVAEVGFLVSYKPLQKLELKGTVVYTHHIKHIQNLLVEAHGIYSFSDAFKVGAGKFLTPLSPVNTYFYAPLNTSVSLPMLVSHHFLMPQSISGFQVAGGFGEDFKTNYVVTYGTYIPGGHRLTGVINVGGAEELAPSGKIIDNEIRNYLGGSARLSGSYKGVISMGLNYFEGTKSRQVFTPDGINYDLVPAKKNSYGIDLHADIAGFKFNGEYWEGKQHTTELATQQENEYVGYYAEAMYSAGSFTPFFRYDFVHDVNSEFLSAPTTAMSLGTSFRPIYETLFKVEYRIVNIKYDGLAMAYYPNIQDSFNHILFSFVYSF